MLPRNFHFITRRCQLFYNCYYSRGNLTWMNKTLTPFFCCFVCNDEKRSYSRWSFSSFSTIQRFSSSQSHRLISSQQHSQLPFIAYRKSIRQTPPKKKTYPLLASLTTFTRTCCCPPLSSYPVAYHYRHNGWFLIIRFIYGVL